MSKAKYFARICSVTGKGMNSGWVFLDGEQYAKTKKAATEIAKKLGYSSIKEAYLNGDVYWTDWEGCEPEYIQTGKLIHEIQTL
jgi:hypothetical protein